MEIIKGRQGSGKTTEMYTRIRETPKGSRVYIIVPDQYTYIAERNLFDVLETDAVSDITVSGLTRLAYRIAGGRSENELRILGNEARSMMIRYAVRSLRGELQAFGKVAASPGFADKLEVLFSEMEKNGIDDVLLRNASADGDGMLSAKMQDVSRLYAAYRDLRGEDYTDRSGLLSRCAPLVKDSPLVRESTFYFDGFNDFDRSDLTFLTELIRYAKDVTFLVTSGEESLFSPAEDLIRDLTACAAAAGKETVFTVTGEKKNSTDAIRHLERSFGAVTPERFTGENDSVFLRRFASVREEVTGAAAAIKKAVREKGMKYADISVTVSDTALYEGPVRDIFREYDIPYFMDTRRNIAYLNPVRILVFLTGMRDDPSADDIISLGKTGLCPVERKDVLLLERYVQRFGIRGRMFFSPFERNEPEGADRWDLESINETRRKLVSAIEAYDNAVKGVSTMGAFAKALYAYVTGPSFSGILTDAVERFRESGDYENANIHAQIHNRIMTIIGALWDFFGDLPYDRETAASMISGALLSSEVAIIPSVSDRVNVGDTLRSRVDRVRFALVLGANEGRMPDTSMSASVFTDREKNDLKNCGITFTSTASYRLSKENFVIYTLLSKPSDILSVSAVSSPDAEPGRVYDRLRAMFGENALPLDITDLLCTKESAFGALSVNLSERRRDPSGHGDKDAVYDEYLSVFRENSDLSALAELADRGLSYAPGAVITDVSAYERLLNLPLVTSVSRLERYAACPFSFFAEYVLKLQENRTDTVETVDTGNVVHSAIEMFSRGCLDGTYDISLMEKDELGAVASDLTEKVIREYRGSVYEVIVSGAYWKGKLLRTVRRALEEIVRQMKASDFLLSASEADFAEGGAMVPIKVMTDSGEVTLRGKIDRIDTWEHGGKKYVKIVDYKTGSTEFDLTKIYYGLSLQLPVYIRTLTGTDGSAPAGMFYLRLSPDLEPAVDENSLEKVGEKVREHFRLNGLTLKDLEVIGALDRNYETGSFIQAVKADSETGLKENDNLKEAEYFAAVTEKAMENVKDLSEKILKGNIAVSPYRMTRSCPCDYCGWKDVCGFSPDMPGSSYRLFSKKKAEDFLS